LCRLGFAALLALGALLPLGFRVLVFYGDGLMQETAFKLKELA